MIHPEPSPHDRRRPTVSGPNNYAARRRIGPTHMMVRSASRRGQHSGLDTPAAHATGPQRQGLSDVFDPSKVRPEQPRGKMGATEYG